MRIRLPEKNGIFAIFAGLFCLVTFAMVGVTLFSFTAQANNQIYLCSISGVPTDYYAIDTVFANVQGWHSVTDLDVFSEYYENRGGAVSVQSADGKNVIAPGTSGSCSFSLKGQKGFLAEYTMQLSGSFSEGLSRLPIYIRLKKGRSYVGGSSAWIPVKDISSLQDTGRFQGSGTSNYTLEWKWPFEDSLEANEADTYLGDRAAGEDLVFTLTVTTVTEVTEYKKRNSSNSTSYDGAGDGSAHVSGLVGYKQPMSGNGSGGTKAAHSGQTGMPGLLGAYGGLDASGNPYVSQGNWQLVDEASHRWMFLGMDGLSYAYSGWYYMENPYSDSGTDKAWFHFDADGIMTFGWYKAAEKTWYYLHGTPDGDLGKMERGWHHDLEDGYSYFLDEETGVMYHGDHEIDGVSYHFQTYEDAGGQHWYYELFEGTDFGRRVYEQVLDVIPFGAMVTDE